MGKAKNGRTEPVSGCSRVFSPVGVCLLLSVAILAVYGQVAGFDQVYYDDADYVFQNPHVNSGLSGANFLWAFSAGYAANWHPVTWLSHMLDVSIFGLEPAGFHIVNLLIHWANALLVLLLFRRATGKLAVAAGVAFLFAIHPLRAESVAWIAERKDVLFVFWGLLAILAYLRWVESRRRLAYLAMLVLLALSLMSKPMLVTFPILLLLLDYWPLGRLPLSWPALRERAPRLVLEKLPIFVLVAGSSVMTVIAQDRGGALQDLATLPLGVRITNSIVAYVEYIGMMFWPTGLAFDYPHPVGRSSGLTVVFCLLVLIGLSLAFWRMRTRHPSFLVGWAWYGVTMLPVIGLVQVGYQSMADRYTYFTQIGLSLIVVQLAVLAFESRKIPRNVLLSVGVAVSLALMVLTFEQVRTWRNLDALMDHALIVEPNNPKAHFGKGLAYYFRGQDDEAMKELEAALRIAPQYVEVRQQMEIVRDRIRRRRSFGN
jgi:hypothetical protein